MGTAGGPPRGSNSTRGWARAPPGGPADAGRRRGRGNRLNRHIARHRGHRKAIVAVAHAILRITYHLLARGISYQDLGLEYYDRRHSERVRRRAIHALERQGYRVTLEKAS